MIVLLILLALLILLMLMKVGVDAGYGADGAFLRVKIGPVRKQLIPKPEVKTKAKKPKKEKPAKEEKTESGKKPKPKRKPDLDFILNLAKIALHALDRFRKRLRIDVFHLRFIMASADPYTTAMTYGYVRTLIGIMTPRIRRAFTVRDSRVELGTDFLATKPDIEARLVLTIRIGRIFSFSFATGIEFLRYMVKSKLQNKKTKTPANEQSASDTDGVQATPKSA